MPAPMTIMSEGRAINALSLTARGASHAGIRPTLHSASHPGLAALLLPQVLPDILGRRALRSGRIAGLGARRDWRHGLFAAKPACRSVVSLDEPLPHVDTPVPHWTFRRIYARHVRVRAHADTSRRLPRAGAAVRPRQQ